ncbi:GNAT family N-acetyltransferase [Acetobacterium carbinolicum]|jgi:ribosomal-protein-alanine N-acetyltransferase|uniref:GNAT family N-acetyltransferase n=1 Tax=Acetobacterium TaxID=33951 RepID=UPI001FA859D0|nr:MULTISPECIES: GNAT family protein [unclassified Acetobacterium]MDZ5725656.1 GNAT family protein [Acetobacterium sp. K1/6]
MKMEFGLREWKLSDAESIVPLANNEKIARNLRNTFPYPYTLDDAHLFISKSIHKNKRKLLNRAVVIDDLASGSISLLMQEDVSSKSGELGFWLGEPFWGKGIMTQAIKQVCENAFAESDVVRIYARPFSENQKARRTLEKAGFELEGVFRKSICKNGVIQDSCMYALTK